MLRNSYAFHRIVNRQRFVNAVPCIRATALMLQSRLSIQRWTSKEEERSG